MKKLSVLFILLALIISLGLYNSFQHQIVSADTKVLIVNKAQHSTDIDMWCMQTLKNGQLRQKYIGRFAIQGDNVSQYKFLIRDYNCEKG